MTLLICKRRVSWHFRLLHPGAERFGSLTQDSRGFSHEGNALLKLYMLRHFLRKASGKKSDIPEYIPDGEPAAGHGRDYHRSYHKVWQCETFDTGFVCALLECLMGASLDEVVSDYMVTYYNLYGVKPGDDKYDIIAEGNIRRNLKRAFGLDDLENADLSESAGEYLQSIGLTDDELKNLKASLAADHETALDKAA